jgi:deoxyribose-phosphate aldolase
MAIAEYQLASMTDYSLLRLNATLEELKRAYQEAGEYGFKAVCVNPIFAGEAASLLEGETPIPLITYCFWL